MLHHFKGMARIEEERKSGRPGAKGVELFKAGKYEEAINEFTNFLKTMPDDANKKVALYNRGMSYYSLGQHNMALEDGESCLKIDPSWVKGYKCKGLALEGLGKRRDALDTFLKGQKMCGSLDENTDTILNPLIERSNLVSGRVFSSGSLLTNCEIIYSIICYEIMGGIPCLTFEIELSRFN